MTAQVLAQTRGQPVGSLKTARAQSAFYVMAITSPWKQHPVKIGVEV
jgi:hypothetical protein